jgi:hypothetical protein
MMTIIIVIIDIVIILTTIMTIHTIIMKEFTNGVGNDITV